MTIVANTSGSTTYGDVPAAGSAQRVVIPVGTTSIDWTVSSPDYHDGDWLPLCAMWNSSNTQIFTWNPFSTGTGGGHTWSSGVSSVPSGAYDIAGFVWQAGANHYPGPWTATIQFQGVSPPSVPNCGGHFRIKPGLPFVKTIDQVLVNAAATFIGRGWLEDFLLTFAGQELDVSVLCASGPPTPASFTAALQINPGRAALEVLYATLWPQVCECDPAFGPSDLPALPTWDRPPGWQDNRTYVVNPTNPCLDLTEVRRKLDELLRITGNDLALDRLVQRYAVPFATIPGATHSHLTGGGSFAVSRLIGVLISWTGGDPAAVWEGTPPYFKDLGWLSASDGGAMLIETRVTRQQQKWMPKHMPMATQLGYYAKPGIELAIQELYAEP